VSAQSASAASGQPKAASTPRPSYAEADAAYYRARAGAFATEAADQIAGTDFWRFRRGRLYVPDASNIQELEQRLAESARSESPAGVVDASAALLASDQADINAHTLRAAALRKTDHVTEADFHAAIAQGLIDSIIHAGDGQSAQTAWTVYRVKEEYEVLKAKHARFVSQSRVSVGDRSYDLLDAEREDGEKLHVYFDVTELMAEQARAAH
jgi:cytochrome c peroxidase